MRAALILLLALPAAGAASTNVTLLRDGAPVAGGEVCRFPAGDRENPFKRWLASQDVTCTATGAVTFPTGKWNVFGKLEGTAVSAAPVVIDGASAPETLSLPLVPAATLAPFLPDGLGGVVYAPRLGNAFPVAAGTGREEGERDLPLRSPCTTFRRVVARSLRSRERDAIQGLRR
jgi:hypothetical protein